MRKEFWQQLRREFHRGHTNMISGNVYSMTQVTTKPTDLFDWFMSKIDEEANKEVPEDEGGAKLIIEI